MAKFLLATVRRLGLFRLWRFLNRNKIVILCLHGVMDEDVRTQWQPLRGQYPRNSLDRTLAMLSKRYNFISMDDAVSMLCGELPVTPYAMVLTFDDGYANNIKHALPILRRYGVPGIIYVSVGHIEKRMPFWFDRMDYALQHAGRTSRQVIVNDEKIMVDTSSRAALQESYARIRATAKRPNRDDEAMTFEIDRLSSEFEAAGGQRLADIFEDDDWTALLTWPEIENTSRKKLIDFGSHTVNHVRLGEVASDTALRELSESKRTLDGHTNNGCFHFCYPNGSYNDDTIELVARAGYRSAVTTKPGLNAMHCNLMTLRRIHLPMADDPINTYYVASGLADAVRSLKRRLRAKVT